MFWCCGTPLCQGIGELWGAVGSLSPVFAELLVCLPLCVFPGLLCGLLTPPEAQEVSVAGGKENILLEGFFF